MKQQLIPKQKLLITKKYNPSLKSYLNVLSFSNDELHEFLKEMSQEHSLIQYEAASYEKDVFLEYDHSLPSFYDTIMEQVRLNFDQYDEDICEYLIFQTDSNGYLKKEIYDHPIYSKNKIEKNLKILRDCEPYGCFSFTLSQCLKLQCLHSDNPLAKTAILLCDHLEEIVSGKVIEVCQILSLDQQELLNAFHFIQTLNPKPAANFAQHAAYATNEFIVTKDHEILEISLTHSDFKCQFDPQDEIQSKEWLQHVKSERKKYEALMKAIEKRNTTLLMIMKIICEKQKDFFLNHAELKHLTLQDIADECGLHVSTISRAIQNKTFEFEHQYYLLKHMLIRSGTNVTEQSIKKRMKEMIEKEDKRHPLSDEKIKKLLSKESINVSRRVIQKYREQCAIPNSSQRKNMV